MCPQIPRDPDYLIRAAELRRIADQIPSAASRRLVREIADEYARMGEILENLVHDGVIPELPSPGSKA